MHFLNAWKAKIIVMYRDVIKHSIKARLDQDSYIKMGFLKKKKYNNSKKYLNYFQICGELSSTCHSQTQDPLANQGKLITRLGSLRLDEDKLRLAPEVRSFSSSTMPDGMDRSSRLDISD